jgi:hypothetical protein
MYYLKSSDIAQLKLQSHPIELSITLSVTLKLTYVFKVVLCFSPVGSTLRVRSRKFPAVTNCTSIDWFYEWPQEALVSVSRRFLEDNELLAVSLAEG